MADALDVGLDVDAVVEALLALTPTVGVERVVAMSPAVAAALDDDVDADLERLQEHGTGLARLVHPSTAP